MKNLTRKLPERPTPISGRKQLRKARHDRIAAYAAAMAGTQLDLDADLEAAGIEQLVKTGKTTK
jgi:hypothetical protein